MAGSDYTDDETEFGEGPTPQNTVLDAFLTPFRALFSKTAFRIYLNILLFIGTTFVLVGVSGIAYAIFYFRFIPTIGIDREVHLQFGDGHPWGTASLDPKFVHSQPYDVAVTLELPRTPSNLDAGNFMIDLTLLSPQSGTGLAAVSNTLSPISHARRPGILTYSSPLVDLARRVVRLPFYVVGWRREAETLEVQMLEKVEFARGARNLPQSLRLEIQSDGKMQFYSARVEFRARFTGLRWLMYRWKITSFVIFSSMFWTVSMASASLTWFILISILQPGTPKEEAKEEDKKEIKDEPEPEMKEEIESDEGSFSTGAVKVKEEEEEEEGSRLLQSYPAVAGDSGMGSGLESAEAQGIQKRRIHSPEE